MNRRLRHHQSASRPVHSVLTLISTALVLLCLELTLGGLAWGSSVPPSPSPSEAFGAPASTPQPIALTGPRTLALVAGLGDGRQRTGQLVEPGDSSLAPPALAPHDSVAVARPQPSLVLARGLLAVRAPPHPAA